MLFLSPLPSPPARFAAYNEGTDAGDFIIETGSRIINNERRSYNSHVAYYRYWRLHNYLPTYFINHYRS